jgi:hypothetical protein
MAGDLLQTAKSVPSNQTAFNLSEFEPIFKAGDDPFQNDWLFW